MLLHWIPRLARMWSINDPLPATAHMIFLVSFGATADALTFGAQSTLLTVLNLSVRYPRAAVLFGAFTKSPVAGIEENIKQQYLKNAVFVGDVLTTIEEAEKALAKIITLGLTPETIIVVTDEWHSRSVKTIWNRIWRKMFPKISICVVAVPSSETIDPESPMVAARTHSAWATVNVCREAFLLLPGSIWLMKKMKLHQRTA
jgi:hypothetical protein